MLIFCTLTGRQCDNRVHCTIIKYIYLFLILFSGIGMEILSVSMYESNLTCMSSKLEICLRLAFFINNCLVLKVCYEVTIQPLLVDCFDIFSQMDMEIWLISIHKSVTYIHAQQTNISSNLGTQVRIDLIRGRQMHGHCVILLCKVISLIWKQN